MAADTTIIDPWTVKSDKRIEYTKLIEHFGCSPIDTKLVNKFESITGEIAHPWIRRGLFFSHKDLDLVLDEFDSGKDIFLYTGRGPSSEAMHLGHMIPFQFTKWLQDVFDSPLVICMSDDEKFFFKDGILEDFNKLTYQNARDIIACGFRLDKTFIYSNLEYMGGQLYSVTAKIMKSITGNQIRGIYGLNLDNNIGQLAWPPMQAAPAFYQAFPDYIIPKNSRCLVSMAIDQTPYFRMARDFANSHHDFIKPAEIHGKFLPALSGTNAKMSSSTSDAGEKTIFMTDTRDDIIRKINKYSFSGGQDTIELHRKLGANLDIDIPYQYLCYFLSDDDKLETIAHRYAKGEMLSGEIKKIVADHICDFVSQHQKNKSDISDQLLPKYFDKTRKLNFIKKKKNIIDNSNDNISYYLQDLSFFRKFP